MLLNDFKLAYNQAQASSVRKIRKQILNDFVQKYKHENRALCRYIYFTTVKHNLDKQAQKYRRSNLIKQDFNVVLTHLSQIHKCSECGKPLNYDYVRNEHKYTEKSYRSLLSIALPTVCSLKCKHTLVKKAVKKHFDAIGEKKKEEHYKKVTQKAQATMLKRYGAPTTLQSKVLREKVKNTVIQRYGVDHVSKSTAIVRKGHETFKRRYYEDSTFRANVLERKKQTCLKRYGVEYAQQADVVKQKLRQVASARTVEQKAEIIKKSKATSLARYGCESWSSTESGREYLRKKALERRESKRSSTGEDKYVSSTVYEFLGRQIECQSKYEIEFVKFLVLEKNYDLNDIIGQFDPEYDDFIFNKIGSFPDFYLKSKNIYVEIKSIHTLIHVNENVLQRNQDKAKRAYDSGISLVWTIGKKPVGKPWKFVSLPQTWFTWDKKKLIAKLNSIFEKNTA